MLPQPGADDVFQSLCMHVCLMVDILGCRRNRSYLGAEELPGHCGLGFGCSLDGCAVSPSGSRDTVSYQDDLRLPNRCRLLRCDTRCVSCIRRRHASIRTFVRIREFDYALECRPLTLPSERCKFILCFFHPQSLDTQGNILASTI